MFLLCDKKEAPPWPHLVICTLLLFLRHVSKMSFSCGRILPICLQPETVLSSGRLNLVSEAWNTFPSFGMHKPCQPAPLSDVLSVFSLLPDSRSRLATEWHLMGRSVSAKSVPSLSLPTALHPYRLSTVSTLFMSVTVSLKHESCTLQTMICYTYTCYCNFLSPPWNWHFLKLC